MVIGNYGLFSTDWFFQREGVLNSRLVEMLDFFCSKLLEEERFEGGKVVSLKNIFGIFFFILPLLLSSFFFAYNFSAQVVPIQGAKKKNGCFFPRADSNFNKSRAKTRFP